MMEVLEIKIESFSDEEQDNFWRNEEKTSICALATAEAASQEESTLSIFDFKVSKEEHDVMSEEAENTLVTVKNEQLDDSSHYGIVYKFNESDDEILNLKKEKEPKEYSTLDALTTGEAASVEEQFLHSITDFKVPKEEQENSDGILLKTENTFVQVNTKNPGDSPQDGIISKFSESGDEALDSSEEDVMSWKKENEPKEEIEQVNSKLELNI